MRILHPTLRHYRTSRRKILVLVLVPTDRLRAPTTLFLIVILQLTAYQETGKSYVGPTRGYGGYTHHVTLSVVPIALVSLHSLVSGLGSGL